MQEANNPHQNAPRNTDQAIPGINANNDDLIQACQQLKNNFIEINEQIEKHTLWTATNYIPSDDDDDDYTIFHQSTDEEQWISTLLICINFNIL